jgi:hypothetical protein
MTRHWIPAAIVVAALATGCGDKSQENTQNPDQTAAAPADQPAAAEPQAVPPAGNNSAARPDTSGSQSTASNRPAPSRPAAPTGAALTPEPRESAPAVPVVHEVTVPAGTNLSLELLTALSSETATVEMPVQARVRRAVEIDGRTAIPSGTMLNGTVTEVDRAGRVKGRSRLAFRFDSATINGVRESLRTNPLSFEGEASKGDDAKKVGIGAGIGAAIGAIAGGGSGAAKGAAIGGAAGTGAVLATRGKEVELAAGTELSATTANAVSVEAR